MSDTMIEAKQDEQRAILTAPGFEDVADYLTELQPGSAWRVALACREDARLLVDDSTGMSIFVSVQWNAPTTVFKVQIDRDCLGYTGRVALSAGAGTIRVNLTRGPKTVAREIARRLLTPETVELWSTAQEHRAAYEATERQRAAIMDRIGAAMGCPIHRPPRETAVIGRHGSQSAEAQCTADGVAQLTFGSLTADQAEALLALWATLHDQAA